MWCFQASSCFQLVSISSARVVISHKIKNKQKNRQQKLCKSLCSNILTKNSFIGNKYQFVKCSIWVVTVQEQSIIIYSEYLCEQKLLKVYKLYGKSQMCKLSSPVLKSIDYVLAFKNVVIKLVKKKMR